ASSGPSRRLDRNAGPTRGRRLWQSSTRRGSRLAGALAVLAARPAARPAFAFLQLLEGPADAALAGLVLLGVFDPADELVACKRRDVVPRLQGCVVGDQGGAQISGQLMHHPTWHTLSGHGARLMPL